MRESRRGSYAPSTTTISSTGLAATRSSTRGRSRRCFGAAEARRGAGGEHDRGDRPITLESAVTDSTTIGWSGCSVAGSPSVPISSTTSSPSVTSPTIAYSGGRPTSSPVTTKNWLPDVPGGSAAVFAIATTPFVYAAPAPAGVDGRVAGPAAARLRRVAALDHEARDDPVEDRVVEEAVLGEETSDAVVAGAGSCRASPRTCRDVRVERERPRLLGVEPLVGWVAPPSSRGGRLDGRRSHCSWRPSRLPRVVSVSALSSSPPHPRRRARAGRRARLRPVRIAGG